MKFTEDHKEISLTESELESSQGRAGVVRHIRGGGGECWIARTIGGISDSQHNTTHSDIHNPSINITITQP